MTKVAHIWLKNEFKTSGNNSSAQNKKNRTLLKSNSGDVYITRVCHFGLIDPVNGFKYQEIPP